MKLPGVFLLALLQFAVFQPFSFSEEVRYQSKDRRDPFVPVSLSGASSNSGAALKIEGIIYDPKGKSVVIVGGEPYAAGDMIGTEKIVKIERNKIVVSSKKGVEQEYWVSEADE